MSNTAMSISEVLARYIAETSYDKLPQTEINAAKESIVDTVAVAIGAAGAPGVTETLNVSRRERATGVSSIWQTGELTSPRQAAFVNSVHAAALDYDSLHHLAIAHSDIVIVPTAIAVAEDARSTGKELLAAIAVGNDVLCRFSLATKGDYRGWFFSSVYGVIAAAAVTAKLLRCDANSIADAMGLAFANCSGTFQAVDERSMSKRALTAFAVQSGILCGYLAAEGFSGPRHIVEGKFGLYNVYQRGDASVITADLGRRFEGAQISRKPFPSCQCNQAAIEATLALREEHQLRASDVAALEVTISSYNDRIVGASFDPSDTPQVAAQFSIQYSVACALLHGKLGIPEIQPETILDPKIGELASRVEVRVDPDNQHTYVPVQVMLTLKNDTVISKTISVLRGTVQSPLSAPEVKAKLASCLAASGYERDNADLNRIFNCLMQIDQEAEVASVMGKVEEWMGAKRGSLTTAA